MIFGYTFIDLFLNIEEVVTRSETFKSNMIDIWIHVHTPFFLNIEEVLTRSEAFKSHMNNIWIHVHTPFHEYWRSAYKIRGFQIPYEWYLDTRSYTFSWILKKWLQDRRLSNPIWLISGYTFIHLFSWILKKCLQDQRLSNPNE